MMWWLMVIPALALLIVVHEWGHYRVARACGVKVLRFSVGFGRVIWRRQRGETEFTLSALPLGGYIRMLDEREAPVDSSERERAFNNRPLRQRVAVVAAGPLANLVLAVLLFAGASMIGVEEPRALLGSPLPGSLAERAGLRAGDLVQATSNDGEQWQEVTALPDLRWRLIKSVSAGAPLFLSLSDSQGHGRRSARLDMAELPTRELDAASYAKLGLVMPLVEPVLGTVNAGGAAADAGLHAGDRVLATDGLPVLDAASLRERIRASAARSMRWRIERAGQSLEIEVTPRAVDDAAQQVGRIEAVVGASPQMLLLRRGPVDALLGGVERTWDVSVLTLRTIGRMVIGQASLRNLSGPISIADYAGQAARQGLSPYLSLLALLSVSLGVLNLLPLPMLDGGHLMYYLFEGVTGRPVSERWLERLQRGGVAVMLLMMSLALYNDFARLLGAN
ncbi:MAG TPA: RIP metalloprotease RseP [Burkholderiaceae bacterium]